MPQCNIMALMWDSHQGRNDVIEVLDVPATEIRPAEGPPELGVDWEDLEAAALDVIEAMGRDRTKFSLARAFGAIVDPELGPRVVRVTMAVAEEG